MVDFLITRLESEMKRQGFNYKSLSRAAGLGETSVRDIITRRAKNPRRDTLQKIATTLGKPLSYFLADAPEATVRLAGEIGRGAKPLRLGAGQVQESVSRGEMEWVEAPPQSEGLELAALRVKGDGLEPFMPEGTLLYFRPQGNRPEDCLNKPCIVQMKNGPVTLRTVMRGTYYGTFNLKDMQGALQENAELEWCAKICFVKLP